jgi:hypothetical protein
LRVRLEGSKLSFHPFVRSNGLNVLQRRRRRRNGDPYAESFRERHTVGISSVKRWAKRILLVVVLYGLYLLTIWLIFPWGEVVNTPGGADPGP